MDIQTVLTLIGSDVSRLEKLSRYYIDLLKRTRLNEEKLFRLQYSDNNPFLK